jgi:membrane associated rhomboid family serine protease
MFIFPIGLGSRLPKWPLMCLFLLLANVFYSIDRFPVVHKYESDVLKGFVEERSRISLIFLYDLCVIRIGEAQTCTAVMPDAIKAVAKGAKEAIGGRDLQPDLKLAIDDHIKESQGGRLPQSAPGPEKSLNVLLAQVRGFNKIAEEFKNIIGNPASVSDAKITGASSFKALLDLEKRMDLAKAEGAARLGLLSYRSQTVMNVIKAGFTHADWLHLIGNMVIFLLLGSFVEARVGAFGVFAVFMAASFIGLLGHVLLSQPHVDILIGASAGVAGVIGAFLALYWNRPIKLWLSWLFVFNRIIYAPTYLAIGLLFVVQDFTGALTSSGNVAHDAHLIGLAIGLGIGFLMKSLDSIHPDFLYPAEELLAIQMKEASEAPQKLALAKKLLSWNPNNLFVLKTALHAEFDRPDFDRGLAAGHLMSYLAIALREKKSVSALHAVQMVPSAVPLSQLVPRLGLKNHLRLADIALKAGDWLTAIRIYDAVLSRFTKAGIQTSVRNSVTKLGQHLVQQDAPVAKLQTVAFSTDILNVIPLQEVPDGRRTAS